MTQLESSFVLDSGDNFYLTDISPKDKPWDVHRSQAGQVQALYEGSSYGRYAERIENCSGLLEFSLLVNPETAEIGLKLKTARFCRVRHCPVCQWRRSLVWRARFFQALPKIRKEYPTSRFLFLTLTVQNCHISDLRSTLAHMNKSWERLSKRKQFPAIGFLKSVEVTRQYTCTKPSKCSYKVSKIRCPNCSPTEYAHPHFHAILMVNASYFGEGYLSQAKWTDLWKESLRADYTPVVNVKSVRPKGSSDDDVADQLAKALCETLKYSVKPDDLVSDREWLLELTSQLHKTRAVAVGGVFKNFLSEEEPEDLIHVDEDNQTESESIDSLWFGWREMLQRYLKCQGTE
jgi:plasmid rolling circle replication initiator protein Rep